ncbi:MAG: trypsin-like peptidase domain-containing protein [Clostridium sp.]
MMSRKRGIGLVVIVAIISSVLSSLLTVAVVKNNILSGTGTGDSKSEIVVNDSGRTQNVYHAVTEKAMPSVVGITTTTITSDNRFAIPTQSEGVGTGVIVDSNGYILTNSHVISDGGANTVNVLFNDGTTSEGRVDWYDATLDLAVVKVEKTGLTPAEFGDSDEVRTGDIAIAIGNPLGLDLQRSVTQGIISGLDRTIETQQGTMTGLMQTDASINSGNSGGPLLNQNGQVIGINTAKASQGEGLGFAISINTAKPIVESIIKTGKFEKVTLGIKGGDVSMYEAATNQKLGVEQGVYVVEVIENTSAQLAGVKAGDIIVKVADTSLTGMSDLNKTLCTYSKEDTTKIVVYRDGKEVTLNVKF